jgi:hypothetical protein
MSRFQEVLKAVVRLRRLFAGRAGFPGMLGFEDIHQSSLRMHVHSARGRVCEADASWSSRKDRTKSEGARGKESLSTTLASQTCPTS